MCLLHVREHITIWPWERVKLVMRHSWLFLLETTFIGGGVFSHVSLVHALSKCHDNKKLSLLSFILFFSHPLQVTGSPFFMLHLCWLCTITPPLHSLLTTFCPSMYFYSYFVNFSMNYPSWKCEFQEMLNSHHAFSLFSQPLPKQPTSLSSPRTRWLYLVSQWLYPVSLWGIGGWYNGPKMAWHWVERETYQVSLLTLISVCLPLSFL